MIITAIAVPKFLQSRASASQGGAAATVRSIGTGLASFNMSYGGFPADLGALGGTTTPPTATGALLLDNTLAQLLKTSPATFNKYDFTYTQINSGAGFTVTAKPSTGNNAVRQFFLDEGGTIHYSDTATPDATSTILGN